MEGSDPSGLHRGQLRLAGQPCPKLLLRRPRARQRPPPRRRRRLRPARTTGTTRLVRCSAIHEIPGPWDHRAMVSTILLRHTRDRSRAPTAMQNGSAVRSASSACRTRRLTEQQVWHRQAGPLPEDTKHQIEELGEKAPYNPLLKNQAVGLDGAERSLLTKLDHIRARKAAAGYYAPPTPSTNLTSSPGTPTATERASPADAEELSQVPGSKSRRAADLPAEQVEYEDRSHRSWSPVSPPSGGGEARSV